MDGCKHLNLKVRPLSLLSHKPGPLTLWTTMLKYAEIKGSQSITKHACFALSQDHDHGPCPICCDIRAASDKTLLVPTHFENSGCKSPPAGVRWAICKQVVPVGRAHDAPTLSFISEYSAEPGHTKPAAVDGCKHLNLKVRPLSLLSHKPGPLTLWTTMLKYAEIRVDSPSKQSMLVLLCHRTMTMVHAQSAPTFELPLTKPSLSQRTLKTLDVDTHLLVYGRQFASRLSLLAERATHQPYHSSQNILLSQGTQNLPLWMVANI